MLDLNNISSNTLSAVTSIDSTTPAPPDRSMSHLASTSPSPKLYHRSIQDILEPQDSKRKKLNNQTASEPHTMSSLDDIKKLNALALSTVNAILHDLPLEHSISYLALQFMKLCKSKHLQQNY